MGIFSVSLTPSERCAVCSAGWKGDSTLQWKYNAIAKEETHWRNIGSLWSADWKTEKTYLTLQLKCKKIQNVAVCPRPVQNSNKIFLKHSFGSISSCSTWFVTVWDLSNTVANNKNSCIQYMIGYCVNSNINSSYTITYRSRRENNSNGINIQWEHKSSSGTYGHMDLHSVWAELKGPFLWKLNGYCKCAGDILVEMSSRNQSVVTVAGICRHKDIWKYCSCAFAAWGGLNQPDWCHCTATAYLRGNNKKVKPKTTVFHWWGAFAPTGLVVCGIAAAGEDTQCQVPPSEKMHHHLRFTFTF